MSVNLRPHYREFLEEVNKHFEVSGHHNIIIIIVIHRLYCLLPQRKCTLISY